MPELTTRNKATAISSASEIEDHSVACDEFTWTDAQWQGDNRGGGEQEAVGRVAAAAAITARSVQLSRGSWCASLQHGQLMAQDEDLDLVGGVGARGSAKSAVYPADQAK